MKNFLLIGASGHTAQHHIKAIKETRNNLVAALDPYNGKRILNSYFPKARFFSKFKQLEYFLDKLHKKGIQIDYMSICSPYFLHESHIRFGLHNNLNVICEKPIVMNPSDIVPLEKLEKESGKNIFNILQLRLHPGIVELKKRVENDKPDEIYDVDLSYITDQDSWYYKSLKGNITQSESVAADIGIHFFDILIWIFGNVKENIVFLNKDDRTAGLLHLEKARVRWFLSTNYETIPKVIKENGKRAFCSMVVNGEEVEINECPPELYAISYEHILNGKGFRIGETQEAIQTVYEIRNIHLTSMIGDYHPLAALPLAIDRNQI